MRTSKEAKEKIIETTIQLLKQEGGNTQNITMRGIAETVGIGTGLINYHFGTKEKLIEICVQRIISNVISVFKPQINKADNKIDILKDVAKQVMDFLMDNQEISRVSILSDLMEPMILDNTMKTVLGFMNVLDNTEENTKRITYCFTLILQGIFLRKDVIKDAIGLDINNKAQRDSFIDFIIEQLYKKNVKENTL